MVDAPTESPKQNFVLAGSLRYQADALSGSQMMGVRRPMVLRNPDRVLQSVHILVSGLRKSSLIIPYANTFLEGTLYRLH